MHNYTLTNNLYEDLELGNFSNGYALLIDYYWN